MSPSSSFLLMAALPGTRNAFTHPPEGPELGAREHVGQLDQLHPEPQVGLVGAVALGRLLPGDAGISAGTS